MPDRIPDGGPAFPVPGLQHDEAFNGATLRDYFAAHAPAEPQDWFRPVMSAQPEKPAYLTNTTPAEREELSGLGDWICSEECKQPRVKAYAVAKEEYDAAMRKWLMDERFQRQVQWPYAWADAMLRARKVSHG